MKFSTRSTVTALAALVAATFHPNPIFAGCTSPSFGPPTAFPVGTYPVSPAVGDFNGDGKLDLVVADQGDPFGCEVNLICDRISVLLGNGNGTFQAAVHYAAGGRPSSIAIGDFNGDNKLDLAVANNTGSGTVSVLLGNGNGTFQSAVSYSTGNSPLSVVVGDFNEDNRLDLAVANYSSPGSVSILLGNANGTFNAKVDYNTGTYPESVAVADFNEDHHLDLVVARNLSSGAVSKLLGNGNGTFQAVSPIATGVSYPESVIAGDFNLDGHADVAVVSDNSPGKVVLLRGQGNGNFLAATNFATGTFPISLKSGDFNRDGLPDFAVGDDTGISVLLGASNGTFQATSGFGSATNYYYLATGDLNGDGSPDLAGANFNASGAVWVLLNTCLGEPKLSAQRSISTLKVSWPFPAAGFVLESSTNISAVSWPVAVESATSNAGNWEVTVPLNQVRRFFRLHKTN